MQILHTIDDPEYGPLVFKVDFESGGIFVTAPALLEKDDPTGIFIEYYGGEVSVHVYNGEDTPNHSSVVMALSPAYVNDVDLPVQTDRNNGRLSEFDNDFEFEDEDEPLDDLFKSNFGAESVDKRTQTDPKQTKVVSNADLKRRAEERKRKRE
jgi:hypothetical protein